MPRCFVTRRFPVFFLIGLFHYDQFVLVYVVYNLLYAYRISPGYNSCRWMLKCVQERGWLSALSWNFHCNLSSAYKFSIDLRFGQSVAGVVWQVTPLRSSTYNRLYLCLYKPMNTTHFTFLNLWPLKLKFSYVGSMVTAYSLWKAKISFIRMKIMACM